MKSIKELKEKIEDYNGRLENPYLPPHSSNLLHQLGKNDAKDKVLQYNELCKFYFEFREAACHIEMPFVSYTEDLVKSTNKYMEFLKTFNSCHQSDFKSSVIPEMFFLLLYKIVKEHNEPYFVSAQSDVPIECIFDLQGGSRMMFKTKRLDMLVYKLSKLTIDNNTQDFIIPLIAMEMKTNLDKNMMSGIEHSVEALKKTFPNSLYYVITECSDMAIDILNYASSGIDEIYILRRQKRADVRKDIDNRNDIDVNLVIDIASECIKQMEQVHKEVLSTETRMTTGKLIH